MRTLVPAKRQINPWRVARWTGLSVIGGVLGYCLIIWPWVIALTTTGFLSGESVDFWPEVVAVILLFLQLLAAVTAFCIWVMDGGPGAVWEWLKEREAAYDRKHAPEDERPS